MGQNYSFHNQDLTFKQGKMNPKISVIVVVFNAAKTIEKTITSVLGQTYNNLELIIIDGGSTDDTIKILKQIHDPALSWTSEPDNGIYDAMNKGIKKATGEWIYFLGADDELYNKEVLDDLFREPRVVENTDFLYGNVRSDAFKGVYDGEFDFKKLLIKNISHQAIFYHRNIFLKIGNYNLKYKTHADWDFNLRCFENKGIKIKYVDRVIAQFGKGGASSSYDISFLRESLLPRKLRLLQTEKNLNNLQNYDEWWRFVRNARLRSEKEFINSGCHLPLPAVVLSIVKRQNKLPESLLRKGVFSKIFMFTNYLFSSHKTQN